MKSPQRTMTSAKPRIPVTGAPTERCPAPFAHNAEYEFARILDFYGINWQYEPRTFPLRWERGHVSEAFTPDFYLSDMNLYVGLTTLKSNLTAEKNRKMRLLKEMYRARTSSCSRSRTTCVCSRSTVTAPSLPIRRPMSTGF